MREKDGVILVFSLINRESLENLTSFYDQLCEVYDDNTPPITLVGNKCDLVESREIEHSEAAEIAEKWHCIEFSVFLSLNFLKF